MTGERRHERQRMTGEMALKGMRDGAQEVRDSAIDGMRDGT